MAPVHILIRGIKAKCDHYKENIKYREKKPENDIPDIPIHVQSTHTQRLQRYAIFAVVAAVVVDDDEREFYCTEYVRSDPYSHRHTSRMWRQNNQQ